MQLTEDQIRRIARQEAKSVSSTYNINGGEGGDSSMSMAYLEDTEINDPQEDDVLVYNGEVWENKDKAPVAKKSDEVEWTGVTDQIVSGNQFNLVDESPADNKLYINSKKRDGSSLQTAITDIYFYNGMGSPNVNIHAQNMIAGGSLTALSDERLKKILHPVGIRIEDIAKAPIVAFRWKDGRDVQEHLGSIAQYWQRIVPELTPEDNDGHLSMDYATIALMSAVSLARKVEELERRIAELEKR